MWNSIYGKIRNFYSNRKTTECENKQIERSDCSFWVKIIYDLKIENHVAFMCYGHQLWAAEKCSRKWLFVWTKKKLYSTFIISCRWNLVVCALLML